VIEPFAPLLALRKLQSFLAPEPLDLLVINPPALDVKRLCDLATAIRKYCFASRMIANRSASSCLGIGRYCREPRARQITRHVGRSDGASFWRM
jgi:hypothetical protein